MTNTLEGAERAIFAVVSQYDRQQPIGRDELVYKVGRLGYELPERVVRDVVKTLRRKGYLICGMAGNNGGYYVAGSMEDYEEFKRMEYVAKISDMSMTVSCMDRSAQEQFGHAYQVSIFGGGF